MALYNDGDQALSINLAGIAAHAQKAHIVYLDTEQGLSAEIIALTSSKGNTQSITLPPISAAMIPLQGLTPVSQRLDRQVHYGATNEAGGMWVLGPAQSLTLSTAALQADLLRLTVGGALPGDIEAVFTSIDGKEEIVPITGLDIKATRIIELRLPANLDPSSFTIRSTASAGKVTILAAALIDELISVTQ